MEIIIEALKQLGPCNSRELADYLKRDVSDLLKELLYLQERWKVYAINSLWRPRTQTKSPFAGVGA